MRGDYKKKFCFCGCSTFNLYQWDSRKGDILFKCERCSCERRVITPGRSVTLYDFGPRVLTKEEVEKTDRRLKELEEKDVGPTR